MILQASTFTVYKNRQISILSTGVNSCRPDLDEIQPVNGVVQLVVAYCIVHRTDSIGPSNHPKQTYAFYLHVGHDLPTLSIQ